MEMQIGCCCGALVCTACRQSRGKNMDSVRLTMTPPSWPYFTASASETSRSPEPTVTWALVPRGLRAQCSNAPPGQRWQSTIVYSTVPNYDTTQHLHTPNLTAIGPEAILKRSPPDLTPGGFSYGVSNPQSPGFVRESCGWLWNDVTVVKSLVGDSFADTATPASWNDYETYEPLNPTDPTSPWGRRLHTSIHPLCGTIIRPGFPYSKYQCYQSAIYQSAFLYNAWGYLPYTQQKAGDPNMTYFVESVTQFRRYWVLRWQTWLVVYGTQNYYQWYPDWDQSVFGPCPDPDTAGFDFVMTQSNVGPLRLLTVGGYNGTMSGNVYNFGAHTELEYAQEINCETDFTDGITLRFNAHYPRIDDVRRLNLSSFPSTVHVGFNVPNP